MDADSTMFTSNVEVIRGGDSNSSKLSLAVLLLVVYTPP